MDIRRIVGSLVLSVVRKKLGEWGVEGETPVSVEIPPQDSYGDFSTNAAMQVARALRRKPREIAAELIAAIR